MGEKMAHDTDPANGALQPEAAIDDLESAINQQIELAIKSGELIVDESGEPQYGFAPSGERSQLPVREWAMVRTEGFKQWFGDWQSDPENASKMVDENGEPKLFYHGTHREFDDFDPLAPSVTADPGINDEASYFTDNLDQAKLYAQHLRQEGKELVQHLARQIANQEHAPKEIGTVWNEFMSALAAGNYSEDDGLVTVALNNQGHDYRLSGDATELEVFFNGKLPTAENPVELTPSGKYMMPGSMVAEPKVVSVFINARDLKQGQSAANTFDRKFMELLDQEGDAVLVDVAGWGDQRPAQHMAAVKDPSKVMIVGSQVV